MLPFLILSENSILSQLSLTLQIIGLILGFDVLSFLYLSLAPFVLIWGGASLLNLSLLSADLWAALARLLFFGEAYSMQMSLESILTASQLYI